MSDKPDVRDRRYMVFVRRFAGVGVALVVLLYGLLVLLDPYNTLHGFFRSSKVVVSSNQRFSYPYIARSAAFDSLIIGTSTTRMLDPERYDQALGLRVANLSLNSGTWWEQREMMRLFLRHHPSPKLFAVGLDVVWCSPSKIGKKLTHRMFPPWAYDEVWWNDYLHLFNLEAIEMAGRKIGYLMGTKAPQYGGNGYKSLNKTGAAYDLDKARRNIYGQVEPIAPAPALASPAILDEELNRMAFPNLEMLDAFMKRLPEKTRKLLIFVPYHQHNQGAPGGASERRYSECKKRVRRIVEKHAGTQVIDFMCRTPFTMDDRNYWDVLHFNEQAAKKVDKQIISFLKTGKRDNRYVCEPF